MDYDVVIATRNRPEALKLSIPLILNQSRKPKSLIVVDASDDHESVKELVNDIAGNSSIEPLILKSKPNLPHQRNIALEHVESPVVMFPDDDSLWFPGHAEAIMRVYERDTGGDIGGVCAADAMKPPPQANLTAHSAYKMKVADLIQRKITRVRNRLFEPWVRPHPFQIHGRSCWNVRSVPDWLPDENAVLVESMGGYKMTYRTEVIRQQGFDEDLGVHVSWAANEDIDACFGVMQHWLVVGARNARVWHHKFFGARASSFELGLIVPFNAAYILCKYSHRGSRARRVFNRRTISNLIKYIPRLCTGSGRQQLRGHLLAMQFMKELWNTPSDCLRQHYLALCRSAFQSQETTQTLCNTK